jgi:hypothetical protein
MQALLNEFPGIRIFGVEDEQGKPLLNEGLVLVYNGHIVVMDTKKHIVEDRGIYIGTMSLEEACADIWLECFDQEQVNEH